MEESVKKADMSSQNKEMLKKYLGIGLGASILTAGLGAAIRRRRSKQNRAKENNAELASNAIVVPIRKEKFLEGLPVPEITKKEDGANDAPVEHETIENNMSAEEVADIKKRILKDKGRKVNFFKKSSNDKDEGQIVSQEAPKKKKEEAGDGEKEERVLPPRDGLGRFTSPTDPVAVIQEEKKAELDFSGSLTNFAAHPIDTVKGMFQASYTRPTFIAAAGVGGYYLATMIVDKINEIRAKKSKGDVEAARNKYVKSLQETEKSAATPVSADTYSDSKNPFSAAGAVLGGAFIIPAVLSYMIANKVMEKRKEKKKKDMAMSDSYPDEPIVLYKTSEDKEISIRPETALALILIKRAMIEYADSDRQLVKTADFVDDAKLALLEASLKSFIPKGTDPKLLEKELSDDEAFDYAMKALEDKKNDKFLQNMLAGFGNKDYNISNDFFGASASLDPVARYRLLTQLSKNKEKAERLKTRMASDQRTNSLLINRLEDPAYSGGYDPIVEKNVNNYLTSKEGWNLDPNGVFYKIISWILNNTGLGKYFAKRKINQMFEDNRAKLKAQEQNNPNDEGAAIEEEEGAEQEDGTAEDGEAVNTGASHQPDQPNPVVAPANQTQVAPTTNPQQVPISNQPVAPTTQPLSAPAAHPVINGATIGAIAGSEGRGDDPYYMQFLTPEQKMIATERDLMGGVDRNIAQWQAMAGMGQNGDQQRRTVMDATAFYPHLQRPAPAPEQRPAPAPTQKSKGNAPVAMPEIKNPYGWLDHLFEPPSWAIKPEGNKGPTVGPVVKPPPNPLPGFKYRASGIPNENFGLEEDLGLDPKVVDKRGPIKIQGRKLRMDNPIITH